MSFNIIGPIRRDDQTARIFTSDVNYPAVSPWCPAVFGFAKFYPSNGQAVLCSELIKDGATNDYDGYFYAINNQSYFRCKFRITDAGALTGVIAPVYDPNVKKIYAGFVLRSGDNISAQIFSSDVTMDYSSGDIGTVTMSEVYNGTYSFTFGETINTFGYVAPLVFPAGGNLGFALVAYYDVFTATPQRPGIIAAFDIETATLYCFSSSFSTSLALPPLGSTMITRRDTASYNTMAWFSAVAGLNLSFTFTEPTLTLGEPNTTIVAGLPGFQTNELSDVYFWADRDGNLWGHSGQSDGLVLYQFANNGSEYRKIYLQAADNQAGKLVNNWANISSSRFWAYSELSNTPLFVSGSVTNPLIYTLAPIKIQKIAGPGQKLPEIELPCQNFCLPLIRMKRL